MHPMMVHYQAITAKGKDLDLFCSKREGEPTEKVRCVCVCVRWRWVGIKRCRKEMVKYGEQSKHSTESLQTAALLTESLY